MHLYFVLRNVFVVITFQFDHANGGRRATTVVIMFNLILQMAAVVPPRGPCHLYRAGRREGFFLECIPSG
jgi:hypothetical protein